MHVADFDHDYKAFYAAMCDGKLIDERNGFKAQREMICERFLDLDSDDEGFEAQHEDLSAELDAVDTYLHLIRAEMRKRGLIKPNGFRQ